ncbi:hypothetical protein G5I_04643 [Acromyrmex echinatior]|uniref:Uncharacterized protein n=1 Tax=Acromyrmex echinatior TaxID=103372 RepID=F4WG70_ACREC|nr:hypothetical protein G5I_04643 [Acromyrmex echinatior]
MLVYVAHSMSLSNEKKTECPHLARIELIVAVDTDKRRQTKGRKRKNNILSYNNCHGLLRHALASLAALNISNRIKLSIAISKYLTCFENIATYFGYSSMIVDDMNKQVTPATWWHHTSLENKVHHIVLRSRSREGGCTCHREASKPNQNISPCVEDESYRDRLSSFPYYESPSSRTRSFSVLAAPSRKGKRKHERMERVPSIGIVVVDVVNNRRQFPYDIRATYWDETLVDLFAFTSVVSRMHRTGNEREKECLAMPRQSTTFTTTSAIKLENMHIVHMSVFLFTVPPTKPIIYDAKRRDMSKLLEAYPEGADLFLVCEVHGESDSDLHCLREFADKRSLRGNCSRERREAQMYVVRTEKSHFVEEPYSLARGQFHLESSTQRTRGKRRELVRQQEMGRETGKSRGELKRVAFSW